MVDSAGEARRVAAVAAAALRVVNEVAAEQLIAAADRGETQARIAIEPVQIPVAAGMAGRLYDRLLIEALESAGEAGLARACRIFEALGFSLATVPEVELDKETDPVVDLVLGIRVHYVELGFTTAEDNRRNARLPLLDAVVLPAAHLWRRRAEAARRIEAYERKALAQIAAQAERGNASCRLAWRVFSSGVPDRTQLQRLAELLRGRGFRVEEIESSAGLRVHW